MSTSTADDHDICEEDVEAAPLSLEDREIPGLNPKVVVHRLTIKPEHRPVKQAQRRFQPELISQIEEEVNKLIEARFIREIKYPTWIANIVLVRKKNNKLRVCVDFRDLNNACPKDDFSLPIMKIMIDATVGHEALSFMDGSSRYSQIRMALEDEEKTTFRTPKVKSKKKCDHQKYPKLVLDRLRKYQLRMNPLKCAFSVTSGKFLGFIVRYRGIKVDHSKIDVIQKYQRLMRKDAVFDWDQSCQNTFDSIKKYLLNPPALSAPAAGKPLILYIATQETSLGALLSQENDKGKECALYYLILFVESMESWNMFFDGATQRSGASVGIVFISPEKHMLSYSFTLSELCSNNVAEYQALIIGLQMASEFGIKYIEIFSDSKLIIN
ncbi:uncharacterized protein E5676_scaffold178G00350 [Cucumis melo var. makuwa]|uniref:RNase H type-1 domain-containing protein n=1 Tax=Cucumis melo var. makuwa TaxID=1194695 RepID=A0A5D3C559_CUCMM|nr:uncharacterized protein E6C27_scaffold1290G00710 [Cucumis melo var. makuwa]TYK05529.1 uncharacterized protein E5676_scaffold178G00350 [Cucumis melo var. makuwa]